MRSRALPACLAISLTVHAVGMVYIATRDAERAPVSEAVEFEWIDLDAAEAIESEVAESEPISLSWIAASDLPDPDERLALPDLRTPETAASEAGRPEDEAASAEPSDVPAPGPATLAMRSATRQPVPGPPTDRPRPGDPSSSILDPRRAIEAVIGDPGPPPPPPPRDPLAPPRVKLEGGLNQVPDGPRSELRPAGGGTFKAEDMTFHAEIGADGRVTIKDKPNLTAHLKIPSARGIGRGLEAWNRKSFEEKRGDKTPSEDHVDSGSEGVAGPSGGTVPLIGGSFDLTDWAMRASGQDPYYHRKKRFFDRTREERTQMARTARTKHIDQALRTLSVQLAKIWANKGMPVAERRALLFQMWDECAETGTQQVVEAGGQARKQIIRFIRIKIPAGSPDAFSAAELAAFNRKRQSTARFQPYP